MRSFKMVATLLVCGACVSQPSVSSPPAVDTVGVRAAFDSLDAAVRRLDTRATLALYDTTSAFVHVFDGNVVRSRAAYDALIPSIYGELRAVDSQMDSVFVVPLAAGAAVVIAAFRETLTDTAGHKTTAHGTWTNVFVRRPDGWKIAAAHSSHVPTASK